MYRLTLEEVRIQLTVSFRIEFRNHLGALRSKELAKREAAEDAIIIRLAKTISNDSCCVIRASPLSYATAKFGTHEPWPAPLPMELNARSEPTER